jgi:HK97 family phage major capsid protein
MKTITEMRAEKKALIDKIEVLRAQVANENRELLDEERDSLKGWLAQIEQLDKDIALEQRTQETLERNKKREREPAKQDPQPKRPKVEVGEDRRSKDEFRSFGEQLQAVYKADTNQGFDPRLLNRASGANEAVASEGGFLVQQDFASGIIENTWETPGLLPFVNKQSISGNSMTMPGVDETSRADGSRNGGVRGYWGAEAAEMTASQPAFREINLKVNKVHVLIYTTEEMLEDVGFLSSWINRVGPEELDFKLTDAIINGDGAGKPLGVLNSACRVDVAKTTNQTADTINQTNVVQMWSRMPARSRMSAIWVINQDCEPQLNLMVDAGSNSIYMPPGGLKERPYSEYASLLGRPVVVLEQCNTVGSLGDIMLMDMNKYIAVDKGGIRAASSMHVRFVYDEMAFKFTYRFDGQPALASAITPFKGSNTISPFIALAARD